MSLVVIEDGEGGGWYGVVGGHIRKLRFLKLITSFFGVTLEDIGFTGSSWADIKHGRCNLVDRDKPETWNDDAREAMDDGYWPWEWEMIYFVDPKGEHLITYWDGQA